MGHKWIKTKFAGVRYREHPTRMHGLSKDRYFTIRYKLNKIDKEEALGWASEGWTAVKAFAERNKLQEAKKTGNGSLSLSDARKAALERTKKQVQREKEEKKLATILLDFYNGFFEIHHQINVKQSTFETDKGMFFKWIMPTLGEMPLNKIEIADIEKLKTRMIEEGKAPKTINNVLALLRQILNYAKEIGYYIENYSLSRVKAIKHDNKRTRFLTHQEADELLTALKEKSYQWYEIALISLHCGLRAGEIFNLKWKDIDCENGFMTIQDTKTSQNRMAYMTADVKKTFQTKIWSDKNEYVFLSHTHQKITSPSNSFERVVKELGLNNGITDRRQKVVFHTLRHTYASWLAETGVDLYTIQKLMGHSNISMTERYAHLGENTFKKAVKNLERSLANGSNI